MPLGDERAPGTLGLPTERPLPRYAERRFSCRALRAEYDAPDAVLIIDTFTEWNHPEVGRAAMQLAGSASVLRLNVTAPAG